MQATTLWRQLKDAAGSFLGRPRRWRFLELLPRESVGAEVGVFRGEFTRHILRVVRPRRLHLIDAWWMLYGDRYPNWGAYTDFGRLETRQAYAETCRIARKGAAAGVCEVHVGDDIECLGAFPPAYFDWVYLDSSHEYDHTRRELAVISRVLKPSGLLLGDDWIEDPNDLHHGVCRAVTELCQASEWRLVAKDAFGQWCVGRISSKTARLGRARVSRPALPAPATPKVDRPLGHRPSSRVFCLPATQTLEDAPACVGLLEGAHGRTTRTTRRSG